jgi:TolA-binding protein
MEGLYNTARADFHRGEFRLAYNSFKQVYETLKTGNLAENSLYWMGLCMLDAKQKENARSLFIHLLDNFPQGSKSCVTLYKLAGMSREEGKPEQQKQYLQRLLSMKECAASNEFEKAAAELEELL